MEVAGEGTGYLLEGSNKGIFSSTLEYSLQQNSEEIMKLEEGKIFLSGCAVRVRKRTDRKVSLENSGEICYSISHYGKKAGAG